MEKKMRRIKLFLLSVLTTTALHAGGMGAVASSKPLITPFMGAEAVYTWSGIDGYNINVINQGLFTNEKVNQGWGGRISAGLLDKISDRFSASAEMGWAYYGRVILKPKFIVSSGVSVAPTSDTLQFNMDQYGLDLLAGVVYTQPKYDLFFKAGALFENLRVKANLNMNQIFAANPTLVFQWNGPTALRLNFPQVMPEIKLGGAYHITDTTLATVSWMHAFGSTFSVEAPNMNSNPIQFGNLTLNLQNPTLNSVMFGLEHHFC